jgi:NADH pyrophosphatase NudC (nudix superfamily)
MGYCYHCGTELSRSKPPGDNQLRETCSHCGHVHYLNPNILVSCIVHSSDKLLWIRRAMGTAGLPRNRKLYASILSITSRATLWSSLR